MKKLLLTSCAILGIFFFSNTQSFAQTQQGQIEIGPGLAYGGKSGDLGISVDGYYRINENFRAGAAFTYFFSENNTTNIAIDLNGNYIFYEENQLMAYGIAGLDIFIWSIDIDSDIVDASGSELGLNLGAGLEYALDFGNLFGELKFAGIGGNYDQLVIGAGIRFPI